MAEVKPGVAVLGCGYWGENLVGHVLQYHPAILELRRLIRDVPALALVAGVPSRSIGWVCQCGVRMEAEDARPRCAA